MDAPNQGQTFFSRAQESTGQVEARIERELHDAGCGHLSGLVELVGSFVYSASQKLILLERESGEGSIEIEATIYSCSRLFNDAFAGFELARRGLVLPALSILRSTFEVVTLGMLMMEDRQVAAKWFNGKRITQSEVRKHLDFARKEYDRYKFLSDQIHPNVFGVAYHSVSIEKGRGVAVAYGGWAASKAAGLMICQFVFAQIAFLEALYANFGEKLSSRDLEWTPDTQKDFPSGVPMTWKNLLSMYRDLAIDVNKKLLSLPDDATTLQGEFEMMGTQ